MRRPFAPLAAAAACSSLLAACGGGSGAAVPTTLPPRTLPTTTVPASTSTTTTTALGTGPVPAVITIQYVDGVFAQLNHVYGNATRSIVAAHKLTRDAVEDLRSMFTDNTLAVQLNLANQVASANYTNVRMPPGDVLSSVRELLTATNVCISALTYSDYSNVLVNASGESGVEYAELTPKPANEDPGHRNPTAWVIASDQSFTSVPASPPPDPCAS